MDILGALLAAQSCGTRSLVDACTDWVDCAGPLVIRAGLAMAAVAAVLILLGAA